MDLQIVINNWEIVRHPDVKKIVKRLPLFGRNVDDPNIIRVDYSVRTRFTEDNQIWHLIRKEREDEKTDNHDAPVNDLDSTHPDGSVTIYRRTLLSSVVHS